MRATQRLSVKKNFYSQQISMLVMFGFYGCFYYSWIVLGLKLVEFEVLS
jgi:hypothetical protein